MTDRMFADCCYGSDEQHLASDPCPQEAQPDRSAKIVREVSQKLTSLSQTMRDAGNDKIADKLFRYAGELNHALIVCPVPDCHLNGAG